MVELRTHDRVPEQGELADAWRDLVDRDPAATIFHGPDYLATWVRQLGTDTTARVRTVHRDGELIGVVAETHEREGSPTGPREVIRFLGGEEVTDYLGPVSAPQDRGAVAGVYLEALADDRNWDQLIGGGLAEDSGWLELLAGEADRVGLQVLERSREDVCPRVDLTGGFEAYLDRLPGKLRQEQRRKARKLARDVGAVELIEVPPGQVADELEVFLDMAGGAGDDKARFFDKPHMQDFFAALADRFGDRGRFRLHVLDVAGAPGAAAVSLTWGDQWGLYNSAFDETLQSLSPGIVLVSQLLRVAAEEGYQTVDLLRGDEPYKYRFGATDRGVDRLTVARNAL